MEDISQSMENVSLMDVDPLNKENITPMHSPNSKRQSPYKSPVSRPSIKISTKTQRLSNVCQLYFLDYYCDKFDYIINRRDRSDKVMSSLNHQDGLTPQQKNLEWKNYVSRERAYLRKKRLKPKHKDFEMITQVGQGGYGQVFLARKKDTKEICALKVLNKGLLIKLNETKHVLTERDILTNTRSDWLVKLLYAFQDAEKVFLAMEFVPGGDFRTLLNNTGYLIPPHSRFYISEMLCAVNALHELGYIHRDLKPENFLIDSKGHIKLTDFGLASGSISKERIESMKLKLRDFSDYKTNFNFDLPSININERQKIFKNFQTSTANFANSIVGSPDYMALDVLEGASYDFTIDYWSLGCILFESLCGYPPFSGSKQEETYYNLKHWEKTLRRPQTKDGRYVFSDRTWQLITKLITKPSLRFKNFSQIKKMHYFSDMNWDTLRQKTPPFTPQLDNEEDAGYFDDFEDEESMMKYKDVFERQNYNEKLLMGSKKLKNSNFIGFTFKHKSNPNNKFAELNTNMNSNPLATLY
ncbi:serine/threonine-protein kinase dbf2 [Yamadazyma tenuis]|uniref:serine/threonine-protein kinase dbf2 n=1 Tax=Candida tenuis TaxID=2315449 RepID=UPI0027A02336|nr:serine/threonine-protein kinase dbf2 [Yamadazyma tenuis]